MSDPILRHPTLVSVAPDGRGVPKLRVRQCVCGHVLYPPQPYGCEKCGRDGAATTPAEVDACGVLTALAIVYAHPKLPTPFALGRITLDAGPVVDAWLAGAPAESAIGSRVHATLVLGAPSEGGSPLLDVRFVLDGEN